MRCVVCYSGTEAYKILDQVESKIDHVIYISHDDKIDEAITKFGDRVHIYSFEDFLVSFF